jgi:ParB family chromosome partitioning protein
MSTLRDRIAKVNMTKILADGDAKHASEVDAEPTDDKDGKRITRTAVGLHAESIYRDELLAKENKKLRSELETFQGSELTKKLDPKSIRASHWVNRIEASFLSKEFESLKSEIESSGGNVQPIKVRPIAKPSESSGEYEIVFGHRRHRACLDLGLDVLALIEELTDADLFAQMDRENRQRENLRPYEQGIMYAKALDEGLFPSMRKMADALGVDQANISRAVALARLPQKVICAFSSPLDIQFNWAALLTNALQKNPDLVLSRAEELSKTEPRLAAAKILERLTVSETMKNTSNKEIEVTGKSGGKATILFNPKKKVFSIAIEGLDENKLNAIEKFFKEL